MGASRTRPQKLVGAVEQHLLKAVASDRRSDCIHPSEVAHESWCPRATYYRITGAPGESSFREIRSESVFETGHDSHRKWQRWFRDIGILQGTWECLDCRHIFEATSPKECPSCYLKFYDHLKYREVPLEDPEYLLAGHADGRVQNALIEVKTVGVGTVRHEYPKLVDRYTFRYRDELGTERSYVDWPGLWAGIRRPFPSHIKQGMIYLHCIRRTDPDVNTIHFLYEPKFVSGMPKEFEVKFQPDLIEDILNQCLVVKSAVEKQRPPKRPLWAEETATICRKCPYRKVCFEHHRPDREDHNSSGGSEEGNSEGEFTASQEADFLFTPSPDSCY